MALGRVEGLTLLGGLWDLVSTVISPLVLIISTFKYSSLLLQPQLLKSDDP